MKREITMKAERIKVLKDYITVCLPYSEIKRDLFFLLNKAIAEHPIEIDLPYCGKCGHYIPDANAKYCINCGCKIIDGEENAK